MKVDRRIFRLSCAATLLCATFVVLGSWYPFDYKAGSSWQAWSAWRDSSEARLSRSDLAINLLLGIPLGFFAFSTLKPWWLRWSSKFGMVEASVQQRWSSCFDVMSAGLVLTFVATLALIVELGQFWFGDRVPSMGDTVAQTIGGFFGVSIAWIYGERIVNRIDSMVFPTSPRTSLETSLNLYMAGYLFGMLMPFIPTVSPSELKAKWTSGMIGLSLGAAWQVDVWHATFLAVVGAATAFPVGYYFARRRFIAWSGLDRLDAIVTSLLFMLILEFAQIFIETRSAQLADVSWSVLGAAAGVLALKRNTE